MCVLIHFSCVQLFATLCTAARQAPLSMGFSRQEYYSGLPCPPPGESSWPRDRTPVSYLAGRFFTTEPPGKPHDERYEVKVTQSCLTVCDPTDYTVHGILQARIPEWVDFSFSRGSSRPRDQTQVSSIASRFFTSWVTRELIKS